MTLSFVMGGAGFLGSHLVDALVAQGDRVVIADNLRSGSLANVEASLRDGRATLVYLDAAQSIESTRAALFKATRGKPISRIFHFSAMENLDVLVDLAIESGACLIYASSRDTNGNALSKSLSELGEAAISFAVQQRGLDARIVRLLDCYGPRMGRADGVLISSLADAIALGTPMSIPGDGLQEHSMIYVDDAMHLLLTLASKPQERLAPLYIGDDKKCTVIEIAETFGRVAGLPVVFDHSDEGKLVPQSCAPHVERDRSMSDASRTTLDAGLAATIAWMRESAGAYV